MLGPSSAAARHRRPRLCPLATCRSALPRPHALCRKQSPSQKSRLQLPPQSWGRKAAPEKQQPKPDESAPAAAASSSSTSPRRPRRKSLPAVVQISGHRLRHQQRKPRADGLIVAPARRGPASSSIPPATSMTNAHVVEGAQRIRVALPLPLDTGPRSARRQTPTPRSPPRRRSQRLPISLYLKSMKRLAHTPAAFTTRPRVGTTRSSPSAARGLQNPSPWASLAPSPPARSDSRSPTSRPTPPSTPQQRRTAGRYEWLVVGINTSSSRPRRQRRPGLRHPRRTSIRLPACAIRSRTSRRNRRRSPGSSPHPRRRPASRATLGRHHWPTSNPTAPPPPPVCGFKISFSTADDRRIETLPLFPQRFYLHRLDQLLKLEILRGDQRKIIYIPAIEQHDPMDQLFDAADPEKSLISRLGILATDLTPALQTEIGHHAILRSNRAGPRRHSHHSRNRPADRRHHPCTQHHSDYVDGGLRAAVVALKSATRSCCKSSAATASRT